MKLISKKTKTENLVSAVLCVNQQSPENVLFHDTVLSRNSSQRGKSNWTNPVTIKLKNCNIYVKLDEWVDLSSDTREGAQAKTRVPVSDQKL